MIVLSILVPSMLADSKESKYQSQINVQLFIIPGPTNHFGLCHSRNQVCSFSLKRYSNTHNYEQCLQNTAYFNLIGLTSQDDLS